jgi:lipopolysaccharide/colanic/teichoic acid biosynthesis glycosyltransferase/glycosyltransferase involved in cell wall biosynthesis
MTGSAGALTRPKADSEIDSAERGSEPKPSRVKVSIILSARNEEKHLGQALDSIANQTYTDWECLIFNDGSTDRTGEMAESYAASDPRFVVFGSAESGGLAKRLNQLVVEARGSLVVRMDADDEMLPDRLERQVAAFDKLSPADQLTTVLGGSVLLMDPDGTSIGERKAPTRTTLSVREFPPVLHPTVMASTEWFKKYPYDESSQFLRAEDSELWVRARGDTTFQNISEPVLRYRTIGSFEPARFVRSQRAMIRIGVAHRAPLLLLRGILGLLVGTLALHSTPVMNLAMKLRRKLLGERLTAILRRSVNAAVQTSGRLAVVAVSIVSFDLGALVHRSTRGAFNVTGGAAAFYCALTVLVAFAIGLPEGPTSKRQGLISSALASATSATLVIFAMTLVPSLFPRFFVLFAPVIQTPLLFLAFLYSRRDDAKEQQRVRVFCVVSSDEFERLVEQVSTYPERPCSIVGFATAEQCRLNPGVLSTQVRSTRASVVVLSKDAHEDGELIDEVRRLHRTGARVRTLVAFYEQWLGKLPTHEVSTLALLVDHSDIHRQVFGRVKRGADILAGLLLGLGLLAALPFVLLLNSVANSGPIFFRQTRVGRDGRHFDLFKLRTMRTDETEKPGDEAGAGAWTQENDPRITTFGRILRRTHLDELPQALNLLRGDLSLVGPRPEQPHYVRELSTAIPLYELRHGVRPGVTGWAQVKWPYGSTVADAEQKLQYDLFYVMHQGLVMDARTIGRTVRSVLLRGGR